MEWKYPYYFLQDDSRDATLPWMVHNWRGLQQGELALYNFHQYSGYPQFGTGQNGTLYPPGYLALLLSQALFGHVYAAVDLLVIFNLALGVLGWLAFFRLLGLSPPAAVFGALACDLNSFQIYGSASWICVALVAAAFPWVLYCGARCLLRPTLEVVVGMVAARLTLFYYGCYQYFLYAAGLEVVALAGIYLALPADQPRASRRMALGSYLASWVHTALLAAPLLLPAWRQVDRSAFRQTSLLLAEFVSFSLPRFSWLGGVFNPFSNVVPGGIAEAMPFLGHIGYVTLALAAIGSYLALRSKLSLRRRWLMLFFLGLAALTMALSMGEFVLYLYKLPIYNRLRWPFRLLLFANYFQAILAVLALDHLLQKFISESRRRLVAAACMILLMANALALYIGFTPKPFRTHIEPIPFEDPLVSKLQNGKILTLGYWFWYQRGAEAFGYDYATLFDLYHFAGYDPLVPNPNAGIAMKLQYFATVEREISRIPWDLMRQWGVRWYVLSYLPTVTDRHRIAHRVDYRPVLSERGMTVTYRDDQRTVYQDNKAKPLVFWDDGRTDPVEYEIKTNSIALSAAPKEAGCLCLNFLWHPAFQASVDGRPVSLSTNPYGQMEIAVPPGRHSIEVKYRDADFERGLWVFAVGILGLALHYTRIRSLPR